MKLTYRLTIVLLTFLLVLGACSTNNNNNNDENKPVVPTIEITDNYGTWSVPINPKNVVSLDNRTFETLETWGVELAAVPKSVMVKESSYVKDDSVLDIGNHSEPNLEVIAAVQPELVIVGQRFARYYEDIVALVPDAVVLNFNIDVSEGVGTQGENLVNGFKQVTLDIGKIFDKNDEAAQLITEFEESIESVKSAYNGSDTVASVIVSGSDIGYSAPRYGRVWGPLYQIFDWVSPLEVDGTSSDHQGDDISVEAIAQSNPDWMMVLDRDAAVSSSEGAVPATDVIEGSEALQNVTAITKSQVIYAPNDTYTNESIHTFIEIFNQLAEAFAK